MTPTETRKIARPRPAVANAPRSDHNLDGDVGTGGSTPQDRANAARYQGAVAETVAINQWYNNPAYLAIMRNCAYTQIDQPGFLHAIPRRWRPQYPFQHADRRRSQLVDVGTTVGSDVWRYGRGYPIAVLKPAPKLLPNRSTQISGSTRAPDELTSIKIGRSTRWIKTQTMTLATSCNTGSPRSRGFCVVSNPPPYYGSD